MCIRDRKNLVAEVLAIVVHHDTATGGATGGAVFAALKDKVKTARVVDGKLSVNHRRPVGG
eukprot:2272049-Prymnesium_polylepis.1